MSQLALDFLREELPDDTGDKSEPWEWYLGVREKRSELLSGYFLEPARKSMAPNYYVLRAHSQGADTAILEQREFIPGDEALLPWFKIPGNMAGDVSVTKRSNSKGPRPNVTKQTFARLEKEAKSDEVWNRHFSEALDVFGRKEVLFNEILYEDGSAALDTAIRIIPEDKNTCFLTFADSRGLLPGQEDSYAQYLNKELPAHKYTTKKSPIVEGEACSICSRIQSLYPNALPGAGLNLINVDRLGVFSHLSNQNLWKKYAV